MEFTYDNVSVKTEFQICRVVILLKNIFQDGCKYDKGLPMCMSRDVMARGCDENGK